MSNDLVVSLFIYMSDPWILVLLLVGMAVDLHPLEQIVNVNWGGGLAVEFAAGRS
jgi:hypothetical protein